MPTPGVVPATLDDLYDWLDGMTDVEQVRVCKLLADRTTTSAMVERADGLIYAMSRRPAGSIEAAMAATGLGRAMVLRSITRHRKHQQPNGRASGAVGGDAG